MKIMVRQAEERDSEQIAAIYAHKSVMAQTSQLPYRSESFWKNFYASRGGDYLELVALLDCHVAGHMGILLHRDPRRKHVGSFGMAVHPEFQRKGCGRALMEELTDLSDNWLNLLRLELQVFSDNLPAVELYRRFNFTVEGESRYSLFKEGKYAHSYTMARFHPAWEQPRSFPAADTKDSMAAE